MANRHFQLKQFSLSDQDCGMPVTTDSILLGSWADLSVTDHVVTGNNLDTKCNTHLLDIGTGCGLLALMAAQRHPRLWIDAIELDPVAAQTAQLNFNKTPWATRINLIIANINQWASTQSNCYEQIICNPPYFSHGPQTDKPSRAHARHQQQLSLIDLLQYCEQLLTKEGVLSLILPILEFEQLQNVADHYPLLQLRRYTSIITATNKPVKRVLVDYIKTTNPVSFIKDQLTLYHHGQPTTQFKTLTKEFYIHF